MGKSHSYSVQSVQEVSRGSYLLTLESRSNHNFDFEPGQYAALQFRSGLHRSPVRCFSMVSPAQDNRHLQFAFRVTGRFTESMSRLKTGQKVVIQGPFGNFSINETYDSNLVFFAGGIGITPYISIIRSHLQAGSTIPIKLYYACRSLADAPFAAQLIQMARQYPTLQVQFIASQDASVSIPGATVSHGIIDNSFVENMSLTPRTTFFLCGPASFMRSITTNLIDRNVPSDRIVSEDFSQNNWRNGSLAIFDGKGLYAATAAALAAVFGVFVLNNIWHTAKSAAVTNQTLLKSTDTTTTPTKSSTTQDTTNTSTSTLQDSANNSTSSLNTPTTSSDANTSNSSTAQSAPMMYYRQPTSGVS